MALEGPSIAILTPLSCLSFSQISKKPPIPYITIVAHRREPEPESKSEPRHKTDSSGF